MTLNAALVPVTEAEAAETGELGGEGDENLDIGAPTATRKSLLHRNICDITLHASILCMHVKKSAMHKFCKRALFSNK